MCETFNKIRRAPKGEGDTWGHQDLSPTLNPTDLTSEHRAVTLIAFEQNQREEVRETPVAGSLKADNGMHNQTFLSTSSTEDSPARTSQWPVTGVALPGIAPDYGLSLSESCPSCGHDGQLLRMSPDFYPQTGETISESSSTGFANSGIAWAGRYWTRKTSESRNAADACSLSQVLESEVSERYYLSAKAAAGILRRAERRGKKLPERLEAALRTVAGRATPSEQPSSQ